MQDTGQLQACNPRGGDRSCQERRQQATGPSPRDVAPHCAAAGDLTVSAAHGRPARRLGDGAPSQQAVVDGRDARGRRGRSRGPPGGVGAGFAAGGGGVTRAPQSPSAEVEFTVGEETHGAAPEGGGRRW